MKEKIKKINEIDDKYLFKYDTILCATDYIKMSKYIKNIFWSHVFLGTFTTLISGLCTLIKTNSIFNLIIEMALWQILMMLGIKLYLDKIIEKSFYKYSNGKAIEISYEFYDEYIMVVKQNEIVLLRYDEFYKCIETNTNFYLRDLHNGKTLILKKDEMKLELIEFIRKKISNISNRT